MHNGYFQLVSAGDGYGIKIVAPEDGGASVQIGEITDYLTLCNQVCDLSALKEELAKGMTTILMLGSGPCPEQSAVIHTKINEDYMQAVMRIIPPSETGAVLTFYDVMEELKFKQIAYGIKESNIRKCLEEGQYCTDILAAKGTPPVHGEDARIEYYFNTDLRAKPTQNEDGSVDFFHLNTINHCKQGDVLARMIPVTMGEYGMNVMGTRIKPRDVKRLSFKYGNNIEVSEDKLTLISKVNGHVTLVDDKVFVSNVFEVENVDTATGNIDYEGSVQINGNVQSNFSVKTKGNIIVNGVVEGAYLEAGGDIVIARGMNGMSKGVLKAGGNITVKFLENVTATAGGYVHADAIIHSKVSAGTEIIADGKRGVITGGKVCATEMVQAKYLGSEMEASTVVEVGVDPEIKARHLQVQKEIMEVAKDLRSVEPIIVTYLQKKKQGAQLSLQQMQYLKSLLETRETKKAQLESLNAELQGFQNIPTAAAKVVVTKEVYPNVKIGIEEVSMVVQNTIKYCKFIKLDGDVKMVGI